MDAVVTREDYIFAVPALHSNLPTQECTITSYGIPITSPRPQPACKARPLESLLFSTAFKVRLWHPYSYPESFFFHFHKERTLYATL